MSTSPANDPSLDEAPLLHIDLDAFFASVEVLDDPTLRGRPVAVGGAGERGVIASASYEARRHGVRSAMPSTTAKRLCPSLVILPGRFDRYEEYSRRFHAIVNDLTPSFEPISLDEVFADLRGLHRLGIRPVAAANNLRDRLRDELSLDSGIGLARNKLFAKLASKEAKPRIVNGQLRRGPGVVWVSPAMEATWLSELPVQALWGVGPATARKLQQLGLRYVRDIAKVDEATLASHLGTSLAATLTAYARGEDDREVLVDRELKSVGHDQTFATSLIGFDSLAAKCLHHAGVVGRALRAKGLVARTLSVAVRFDDLTSVSRAQTLPFGVDDDVALASVAQALVASIQLDRPVRLLALHASTLLERTRNQVQLSFGVDDAGGQSRHEAVERSRAHQVNNEALRDVVDDIRRRYGDTSLGSAAQLGGDGLSVGRQRGSNPFGPADDKHPD